MQYEKYEYITPWSLQPTVDYLPTSPKPFLPLSIHTHYCTNTEPRRMIVT